MAKQSSPALNRDAIADAVHQACVELRKNDGAGGCLMYAVAGHRLLQNLDPDSDFSIQCGGLELQPDPDVPDPWCTLDPKDGGWSKGQFHCWLANEAGELIDFSARHYKALCKRIPGKECVDWNQPDPPAYLWCLSRDLPGWIRFNPHPDARRETDEWIRNNIDHPRGPKGLWEATARHYERLTS